LVLTTHFEKALAGITPIEGVSNSRFVGVSDEEPQERVLKWFNFHTGIGRLKIGVNVGNTITAGFRPNND